MEKEREREYDEVEEGGHIFMTRLYEEEGGEQIASTHSLAEAGSRGTKDKGEEITERDGAITIPGTVLRSL